MKWLKNLFRRQEQPKGFLYLDFEDLFPYYFWISDWAQDKDFPDGFRYKVCSGRSPKRGGFDVVTIRELKDGTKEEAHRFFAPADKFDEGTPLIGELESAFGVQFEKFDFAACETFESFQQKVIEVGWEASGG